MKRKGPTNITAPRAPLPRPQRIRMPAVLVFRVFILGAVAVLACVWALWRHHTIPPRKMLVAPPAPTEIEVEP